MWERVVISRSGDPADTHSNGQSIAELAEEARLGPAELVLRLCAERGNATQVVLFYRTEQDMRAFLAHPLSIVGSDGSAIPFEKGDEKPHPRNYGAAVRVVGRYARDVGLLPLETAIHKMTARAAERMGIRDRGRLEVGLAADLVLFDPASTADTATFTDPCRPPVGVRAVVVNGQVAVGDGRQSDARAGRVLRRTA